MNCVQLILLQLIFLAVTAKDSVASKVTKQILDSIEKSAEFQLKVSKQIIEKDLIILVEKKIATETAKTASEEIPILGSLISFGNAGVRFYYGQVLRGFSEIAAGLLGLTGVGGLAIPGIHLGILITDIVEILIDQGKVGPKSQKTVNNSSSSQSNQHKEVQNDPSNPEQEQLQDFY